MLTLYFAKIPTSTNECLNVSINNLIFVGFSLFDSLWLNSRYSRLLLKFASSLAKKVYIGKNSFSEMKLLNAGLSPEPKINQYYHANQV